MSEMVARRYVKALIESVGKDNIADVALSLRSVVSVFNSLKVKTILVSNDISADQKVDFLISMLDNQSDKLVNFIKLLGVYNRLGLLPVILHELEYEVANILNTHRGVIFSSKKIDKSRIDNISQGLSRRYNTTVELENIVGEYEGIKVEIDTLGLEIGFSTKKLQKQLIESILRAI
jgi:F-type H+-transporting ATPase subunit delta